MPNIQVLYISYDGILEPLGQSQVLRYLEHLSGQHQITLISYEKNSDLKQSAELNNIKDRLLKYDIKWYPLKYHKKPSGLATAFDIVHGCLIAAYLCLRYKIHIVHARSYVPSVISLFLKKLFNIKYIFDMRGFWADERIDGGLWPKNGRMYRVAKWFEKRFLLSADCVVSLTHAAVDEMKTFSYLQGNIPNFKVITTCADLKVFDIKESNKNDLSGDSFVLGYVGSVGVWYLFDETLRCFKLIQQKIPNAELHIYNKGGHAYIKERMSCLAIDPLNVTIKTTDHIGIANAMQTMDAGVFFIKPLYSKMSSAPTKLGEFLGCGVPCLSNTKVGDMAEILKSEKVGVAIDSFDEHVMESGIEEFLLLLKEPDIKNRCRTAALKHFSLEFGVQSYHRIYNELTE